MLRIIKIISIVVGGLWCALLFDRQSIGINLPLFGLYVLLVSAFLRRPDKPSLLFYVVAAAWLLTAISTVYYHSVLAITMNIASLLALAGIMHATRLRSLVNAFLHAGVLLGLAVPGFFAGKEFFNKDVARPKQKRRSLVVGVVVVLSVLAIFTTLFAFSNPVFGDIISNIFSRLSLANVHIFVLGAFITFAFLIKYSAPFFADKDAVADDNLVRRRKHYPNQRSFPARRLDAENKLAMVLFLLLNLLILVFNVIDVRWVWFNFVWDGEYLRPFVHQGTFILIFTLMLSITLVLLFFRGNLNFFSKAKPLKLMVYLWLLQNMILATSVGMRTVRYVQFCNLAYLRIGLFFFLLAVVFGLITVFIKIYKGKSAWFMLRTNALFVFCGLCLLTTADWNRIIARYNITHAATAFFPRDYMISLPDNALPVLVENYRLFDVPFIDDHNHQYVYKEFRNNNKKSYYGTIGLDITDTCRNYLDLLQYKVNRFRYECNHRDWQSWNYADQRAFDQLNIMIDTMPALSREDTLIVIKKMN
jgi:hypothetical protein